MQSDGKITEKEILAMGISLCSCTDLGFFVYFDEKGAGVLFKFSGCKYPDFCIFYVLFSIFFKEYKTDHKKEY